LKKTKQFTVYLFYKNKRKEITTNDKFPFNNLHWIWSKPGDKELFAKILEKAYIKYQMIYGIYAKQNSNDQELLEKIYCIICGGGYERDAMKILINSKSKIIYSLKENNITDSEQIFQDIKCYLKEKKGLITLARVFDVNQKNTHAYSVIGAWNFTQGKKKNIMY